MSIHKIEVKPHQGYHMAMFENRVELKDYTLGLGKTEWEAVADFVSKKSQGIKFDETSMPLVGYKLGD